MFLTAQRSFRAAAAALSFSALALAVTPGWMPATSHAQDGGGPAQAPFFNLNEDGFETPNSVAAAWFLPPKMMNGPRHKVREWAMCDGLNVTFQIDSDFGFYEVFTVDAVQERVAEIYAIAKLKEMAQDDRFVKESGENLGDKAKAAGKVFTDPEDFFESIPKGASRFIGGIGESLKGKRSKYEDKAYTNLLGAATAKRRIAFKLGVNPYSSNKTFQDALNKVAWSEASANLVTNTLVSFIPFGVGTAINWNQRLQNEVIDHSASDLRIRNRKKLLALGVPRSTADKLLMHPWYSPLHNTIITQCLEDVGGKTNPGAFIATAAGAWNEADARFFTHVAELMSKYSTSVAPIARINPGDRLVSFVDARGRLVFPVPIDYGIYTERLAARLQTLPQLRKKGQQVVLYTTGQFSPLAKGKLEKAGINIVFVNLGAQQM